MKIIVNNTNNILESAFYTETDLSFSLYINTVEKWRMYDSYTYAHPPTLIYHYGSDSVSLIPENEQDIEILNRPQFDHHNKDQLWVLFPVEEVYEKIRHTKNT